MDYSPASILEHWASEVTDILKATKRNPEDERSRKKLATTLARSLSFAKRRTGVERTPKDTELYKLAMVLRRSHSDEEFEKSLKKELPKAKPGILEKYKLDWQLPWTEEETPKERKRRRRVKEAPVVETPQVDVAVRIENLEKSMSQIQQQLSEFAGAIKGMKELSNQVQELIQKLRAHQHDREDGKAYIMEKKEL